MISLANISKQFGGTVLLRDVSFHIGRGDRIAFVGSNGTGKSTLMKIITGAIDADSGRIAHSRFTTAGYLPQDGVYHRGETLYEEVATVFHDITDLQRRMSDIAQEIKVLTNDGAAHSTEVTELLDELGTIQHTIEHRDGYTIEARIRQILSGLGFSERDMNRMTEEFSGGWQMRIEIAKLLLKEPTVLLLDEPTNHLDIESLQWLEHYLQNYKGSIILVSHDSRFLDNIIHRVLEISMGNVTLFSGNFSAYLKQKALRDEQTRAAYEQQQQLIEKTEQFVSRFRYDKRRARQAQSRLRMLEKMERIEVEGTEKAVSFDFPDAPRPGRVLMELEGVTKRYGTDFIFKDTSLRIDRGDRIALLGVNGAGKSTLARIIAGLEPIQGGERRRGHNVVISYFSQNLADTLDSELTVMETLEAAAPGTPNRELRTILGCFLFSGDDVFKPVSVLSGGEKSRLAIAMMLLKPANLLIFDEPTNHLDSASKAVLQQSLGTYSGSYVIVSHDRDFLAPLINKVVAIGPAGLDIFPGSVDDYLDRLRLTEETTAVPEAEEHKTGQSRSDKERKRIEAEKRRSIHKKLKPLKEKQQTLEAMITDGESRKAEIEDAFSDPTTYGDETTIQNLHIEHDQIASRLDRLYAEWAEIEEMIEGITLE
jgi:ATP-binding cassette subfamily F protein 3